MVGENMTVCFDVRTEILLDKLGPAVREAYNDNSTTPLWMKRCNMCALTFPTVNKKMKHMETDAHQKTRCEVMGESWVPTPTPKCTLCNIAFKSENNLAAHMKTQRHAKNMKRQMNGGYKTLYCTLCDPTKKKGFTGRFARKKLNQHCKGKKHMARFAKLA